MGSSLAVACEPLDVAGMIPLSAAERREPLFFFGTLTDRDVLAYVLGRPVDLDDLVPAALDGHRRVRALYASYPLLAAAPAGSEVRGALLRRATRRDIARINHFESGEYVAELRPVRDVRSGTMRRAWLYVALDHLAASDEAWDLEAWRTLHKRDFFAACDGWMAGCPEPG